MRQSFLYNGEVVATANVKDFLKIPKMNGHYNLSMAKLFIKKFFACNFLNRILYFRIGVRSLSRILNIFNNLK